MRILLVDPPGKNKGLNTGLGYLSALLKENHEVKVLDLNNTEIGFCGDPNPDMPMNELEKRIDDLIADHPEILDLEDPWGLFKIKEFKCKDLQPTFAQACAALQQVRLRHK